MACRSLEYLVTHSLIEREILLPSGPCVLSVATVFLSFFGHLRCRRALDRFQVRTAQMHASPVRSTLPCSPLASSVCLQTRMRVFVACQGSLSNLRACGLLARRWRPAQAHARHFMCNRSIPLSTWVSGLCDALLSISKSQTTLLSTAWRSRLASIGDQNSLSSRQCFWCC